MGFLYSSRTVFRYLDFLCSCDPFFCRGSYTLAPLNEAHCLIPSCWHSRTHNLCYDARFWSFQLRSFQSSRCITATPMFTVVWNPSSHFFNHSYDHKYLKKCLSLCRSTNSLSLLLIKMRSKVGYIFLLGRRD